MLAAILTLLVFVLPIVLAFAYEAYRKKQIVFFSAGLGVLGVVFVLLGSVVMVPYTATETFNNYPYKSPVTWADESFTLQPYANKSYTLDLIRENSSFVYVKVEGITGPIVFKIAEGGWLHYIVVEIKIPSVTPPEKPFEYYWTPPWYLGGWLFIFENPHDTTTNVTVKILCYNYNVEWQEKVTRHRPAIDPSFAYVGVVLIMGGIGLNLAQNLYETKHYKKKPKPMPSEKE